ncbi:MAG TPA: DUF4396 domain-containing protein [Puia sp.]|nr:DUF4396 domain-containing protein [Puia sp.]
MGTPHVIATVSLATAVACFLVLLIDILAGHRQHMLIMNIVYPITALYAGPLALIVYYTIGRRSTRKAVMQAKTRAKPPPDMQKPMWQNTIVATLHCGSGCTLGDIVAEAFLLPFPFALFGMTLYGAWVVEFVLAFGFGILFQYYSIKPMKELSAGPALKAALRADTLSLTCWQTGMYGWMAVATFLIFHRELKGSEPVFWFMMQIGMIFGFIAAYPVNWWLLKRKIKEVM